MRKLIGVAVSAGLLALLYAYVDVNAVWAAAKAADPRWLTAGILLLVPLTLLTAWRFKMLVRDGGVGFGEANRLILAASTLNLFLPSKLGDLAKGHALARRHAIAPGLAYSIVVLEKALDLLSLLLWGVFALIIVGWSRPGMLVFLVPVGCLAGVLALLVSPLPILPLLLRHFGGLLPRKLSGAVDAFAVGWQDLSVWFWRTRLRAVGLIILSIALWAGHLFQFWLFARALGGDISLVENAAFATLSILVGLMPFTFAGIGTRDAAIVYFYSSVLSPGAAAFLGILATLRYLLPALAGIPFVTALAGLRKAETHAAVPINRIGKSRM